MKIAIFGTDNEAKKVLTKLLPSKELVFFQERLSEKTAHKAKDAEIVSMTVNSEAPKEVIDAFPHLKFITTRSTGFDHINVEYARHKGIAVSNVPTYGSRTVAEFTFALILTLSRKIFDAYHELREHGSFDITNLRGFDLEGKTLGVIGVGMIGKEVIKIAKGFNMKVLACDPDPDKDFLREHALDCVDLIELLKNSDIVTIHVPYMENTHHLINSKNISNFKDGAYLINTARGEVVETTALLQALSTGKLAGAGLDVLEGERQLKEEIELLDDERNWRKDFRTLLEDHIIIDLPQTVVTPHIAFYSAEAEHRILKETAENIKAFTSNKPRNLIS